MTGRTFECEDGGILGTAALELDLFKACPIEKGRKKGIEEGIEKGIEKGIDLGRAETLVKAVELMMKNLGDKYNNGRWQLEVAGSLSRF